MNVDCPPRRRCRRLHKMENWRLCNGARPYWYCGQCNRISMAAMRVRKRQRTRAEELQQRREEREFPAGYVFHPQRPIKPTPAGNVPNHELRFQVMRRMRRDPDLTFGEIAERCDWYTKAGASDSTRVARCLGIAPFYDSDMRGGIGYRHSIREPDAAAICRAIHVDPWEVGI